MSRVFKVALYIYIYIYKYVSGYRYVFGTIWNVSRGGENGPTEKFTSAKRNSSGAGGSPGKPKTIVQTIKRLSNSHRFITYDFGYRRRVAKQDRFSFDFFF